MIAALALLRAPYRLMRAEVALCNAVRIANRTGNLPTPVADDSPRWAHALAAVFPRPADRFSAASNLLDAADCVDAGRGRLLRGVAHLVGGQFGAALRDFEQISLRARTASAWSNLAATHAALDTNGGNREHWFGILSGARHALRRDPTAASARFAQALALERIGLTIPAAAAWRAYLESTPADRWSTMARARLARAMARNDDRSVWTRRAQPAVASDELSVLTREVPQQARTFAESVYVCAWADAVVAEDHVAQATEIQHLETIGRTLRLHRGESMVADVVASIRSTPRPREYAEALRIYRRGRLSLRDHKPEAALPDLERARVQFLSLGSPMASLSEAYVGIALVEASRYSEARRRLRCLLSVERPALSHHDGLIALILYHLALIDASDGNWRDALRNAERSSAISLRLGERGNAGLAKSLVSESRDFLGQPAAAWTEAVEAIRLLMAAGDTTRTRIFVASLSHAELRAKRWESASILTDVEEALAGRTIVPELDCDMHLRRAAAAHGLGETRAVMRWLGRARADAGAVMDASIRAKLVVDVAAVSGALLRRESPRNAVALLSEAISFQHRASRSVLLPQLYLERSRAYAALGRMPDAERDLADGIEQLEYQRARAVSAELRSTLFHDSRELFDDAVSMALQRNDIVAALDIIERARARTIIEEMQLSSSPTAPTSWRTLSPSDRVVIEYEVLADRIVIFVFDGRRLSATAVAVSREELLQAVAAFRRALTDRGPMDEVELPAKRLYLWLIAPVTQRIVAFRTLVVVPDPMLQRIPFNALLDPQTGSYLVERHEVIHAPSAAVHLAAAARIRVRPTVLTAVVVANPYLEQGEERSFASLPFADVEGQHIARLYQGMVLRGAEATKANVERLVPSHDIVHFGCHGLSRPRDPWTSAIVLARSGADDGLLTAARIAQLSLRRTRVVVLASCATADDESTSVEGAPTVAKAFLIAGVPSVVATLWDVEDGEVGRLVRTFHATLLRGDTSGGALRHAQLEALRGASPDLRHPGYWAVFALTGASN